MEDNIVKVQVKKAVITAAGRGTRFLPITKIIPKEMLPIGNQPTLHYLLEECQQSGIEEVAIIIREHGSLTEKYFEKDWGLEEFLQAKGKPDLLAAISNPSLGLKLTFIQQRVDFPMGHGAPLLSAKEWVGSDNFAMLFCDDLVLGPTPGLSQAIRAWQKRPELSGVILTQEVPESELIHFSSAKFKDDTLAADQGDGIRLLDSYIEKPKPGQTTYSKESFFGRVVYSADIMRHLEQNLALQRDNQGEFSAWDAMVSLSKERDFGVLKVDGEWLTTGNQTQMSYASSRILSGK